MYNDKVKRKFLESLPDNDGRHKREVFFESIADLETEKHKDIAEFTVEEFWEMISIKGGRTTRTAASRASDIRMYIRWVIKNEPSIKANHDLLNKRDRTKQGLINEESFKGLYLKNPQHLNEVLDKINIAMGEPLDYMGANRTRRVYWWLAYAGMESKDVCDVVAEEVDLSSMVVRHKGRVYPIYELAKSDFEAAVNMRTIHTLRAGKYDITSPRATGSQLLRTVSEIELPTLQAGTARVMTRALKKFPEIPRLKWQSVQMSGLFFEAYRKELETGIEPNFKSYAASIISYRAKIDIDENASYITNRSEYVRIAATASTLLHDYKTWKSVFWE